MVKSFSICLLAISIMGLLGLLAISIMGLLGLLAKSMEPHWSHGVNNGCPITTNGGRVPVLVLVQVHEEV